MNRCVPDWNFEADFPVSLQKKTMGPDNELVELLWQNGQVVLSSQTSRKFANESRQVERHDQPTFRSSGLCGNSSSLVQDDETMSWIHYPLEDSFDKDLCSNFFSELPSSDPIETDKPVRQFEAEEKIVKFSPSTANHVAPSSQQTSIKSSVVPEFSGKPMPPPRFQFPDSAHSALQNPNLGDLGKFVNLSQFPNQVRGDLGSSNAQFREKGSGSLQQGDVKESSVMTVVSSHCGSNQLPHDPDLSSGFRTTGLSSAPFKGDVRKITAAQSEKGLTETLEPTVTSSSGGSGSSFCRTEKQSTTVSGHKRKGGDPEESECQSKAAELDSSGGKKPAQRSGSTRRSRAAEVHNLSERRRRDRINEKMKALQDLIPHCNKTDKASMLDEAIEYLKSLQLQLQVMWMGSGMAPMMFPGVQHYMSRMSMGMGPPPLPSIHNAMHLPRIPLVDQSISVATPNQAIMCQTPVLGPVNCPTQMQNPSFSEQYARYMQQMQTATQSMNMFRFGTHSVQQSQMMVPPGSSNAPSSGGAAKQDNQ